MSKSDRYRATAEAAEGIDTRTLTEAAAPDGFELVGDGATLDGRDVQAVCVQLETLPDEWATEATEPAGRNATSSSGGDGAPTAAADGSQEGENPDRGRNATSTGDSASSSCRGRERTRIGIEL